MGDNTTSLIIAGTVIALVVVAAVIILLRHKDKIAMMMLGVDDSDPIVINRGKQRMKFMGRDLDPMTGAPVDMTDSFTVNSIYPPTGTFSPIIGMLPSDSGVFDVLDNGSDMMDDAIFDADAYSTPVDPFAAMPQNAYAAGMSAEMEREQQQYVRPDAPKNRAAKRGGIESSASNDANDAPAQPDVMVSAVRAQSTGKFTVPSDKLDMSDRRYGTEQQDADYEIIEDGSSLDGMSTESIVNAVNDAARMYSAADAARSVAKEEAAKVTTKPATEAKQDAKPTAEKKSEPKSETLCSVIGTVLGAPRVKETSKGVEIRLCIRPNGSSKVIDLVAFNKNKAIAKYFQDGMDYSVTYRVEGDMNVVKRSQKR